MNNLENLPVEIIEIILKKLNFNDIINLSRSSEKLAKICKNIKITKPVLVGCEYKDYIKLKFDYPNVNFKLDLSWFDKIVAKPTYSNLI